MPSIDQKLCKFLISEDLTKKIPVFKNLSWFCTFNLGVRVALIPKSYLRMSKNVRKFQSPSGNTKIHSRRTTNSPLTHLLVFCHSPPFSNLIKFKIMPCCPVIYFKQLEMKNKVQMMASFECILLGLRFTNWLFFY